jgi:alcohol dehydrogenase class IV
MNPSISTYVWPGQTHFGFGAAELVGREARARQAGHVLIVTDPGVVAAGLVGPVEASLKAAGLCSTVYDRVVPNPDAESVDAAVAAYRDCDANFIVGIGGGSALDTAKTLRLVAGGPPEGCTAEYSLRLKDKARPVPPPSSLPSFIAIPTTAGTGSEVTPWAVITDLEAKAKFGVGGPDLVPTVALVDPDLTMSLPPFLTAATGMDALTHCIEAYVSINDNPMLDPMILYGIELIGRSLRIAVAQGHKAAARRDMALASMIGGIAISSKYLGVCHSLAHPLSALADVQHGVANALMLPHQMAYSLPGALDRYARISEALDAPHPVRGPLRKRAKRAVKAVKEMIRDIDLPEHLRDVGITQALIPQLAQSAYQDSNWMSNPRGVSEPVMAQLYQKAF